MHQWVLLKYGLEGCLATWTGTKGNQKLRPQADGLRSLQATIREDRFPRFWLWRAVEELMLWNIFSQIPYYRCLCPSFTHSSASDSFEMGDRGQANTSVSLGPPLGAFITVCLQRASAHLSLGIKTYPGSKFRSGHPRVWGLSLFASWLPNQDPWYILQ